MEKKVIVSVDPFNIQRKVVAYAEEIARAGERELLIYSVQSAPVLSQPVSPYPSLGAELLPGHIEVADELANKFHEEVKSRYPRTSLETGVGFTATSIVSKIQEIADKTTGRAGTLLVLPKTHEYSWWNEVIGTVETTVAAEAPCPVLIVPEDMEYKGISRVMYLADMEAVKNYEYPGFKFLQAFSDTFTAELVIGFIGNPIDSEDTDIKLGEVTDLLKRSLPFRFSQEYRFFPQSTPEEILQTAKITNTDILAFPHRDSSMFKRFFENEITRTLILKTNTPVLVF